jgi:predicted O-linked N-acetylglucosamine transferase (SPINDLY family)
MFQRAWQHHQANDLAQAEQLYRQVLQGAPAHADAWCFLGAVYHARGNAAEAEACLRRAVELVPSYATAHNYLGITRAQLGRLDEAAASFQEALRWEPGMADGFNNLGLVRQQQGWLSEAIHNYQQALRHNPQLTAARANLDGAIQQQARRERAAPDSPADHGAAQEAQSCHRRGLELARQGQLDAALAQFQQAVRFHPNFFEAHNDLGTALMMLSRPDEAGASYRQALRLRPDHALAHYNLGIVLEQQGNLDEACAAYREAVRLRPEHVDARNNLGNVLRELGQPAEAEACYREALRRKPDAAGIHDNLGRLLQEQGRPEEALAECQRAMGLQPNSAELRFSLANVLRDQRRLAEAEAGYRHALQLRPDYPEAHNNLGGVLKDQGLLDEALACYRRALDLRPDPAYQSNLLYTLHFHADSDPVLLAEEHRRWNERFGNPLKPRTTAYPNPPDPERRLRVGLVSPDFRRHPIGIFLLPLLEALAPQPLDLICYSSVTAPDELTRQLQDLVDSWRDVARLTDEQLAACIRQDQIDLLVDLTAHMSRNRLLTFARKPAPVQVTYLAYCSTTGLYAIDYRLTDPYLDPPNQPRDYYSETSIWLPETYWYYRPLIEAPAIRSAPAIGTEQITFGCLNNFSKVTPPVLAVWRDVLTAMPDASLVLHAHRGPHRDRVHAFFGERGIAPERVAFVGYASFPEYLQLYDQIDIGLDPFPYGGGTTTCDALWMGVPVISQAGRTAVSRAGLSILSNAGLPELVARTPREYVRLAVELARDRDRLADLRSSLRQRLQRSPLMDGSRFAANLQAAFRSMWRAWCAKQ